MVQQRGGVQLKGGVGEEGDRYERHADAVADAVVAGRSAEALLAAGPGGEGGGGGPSIQRKVTIGGDQHLPPASLDNPQVKHLHEDDKVRRFKDQQELETFAAKGGIEGMGLMKGDTWVRLPEQMLVLGEDHSKPVVPDILQGVGTRKFRYEGFAHHPEARLQGSEELTEHAGAIERVRPQHHGLQEDGDETHDAEHAVPRYARALADIIELKKAQKKEIKKVPSSTREGTMIDNPAYAEAGSDLGDGYGLARTLLASLLPALHYVKSYGTKRIGSKIKRFYGWHKKAVDRSIEILDKRDERTMVDFDQLPIAKDLGDLTTAFEEEARKILGIKSGKDLEKFKHGLIRDKEDTDGKVALGPRAKENDYLRDKSMLETIKQAMSTGDRVFVIGDAHRQKLEGYIKSLGLPVYLDSVFVDEQKALNSQAGAGHSRQEGAKIKKLQDKAKGVRTSNALVMGESFRILGFNPSDFPDCELVVTGAKLDNEERKEYKPIADPVTIQIRYKGERATIDVLNTTSHPKPI